MVIQNCEGKYEATYHLIRIMQQSGNITAMCHFAFVLHKKSGKEKLSIV